MAGTTDDEGEAGAGDDGGRPGPRRPLTRERVVAAAMALADEGGLAAVSMRKVAARLGVEAMSLYHHVANKEELLRDMGDVVMGEVELPRPGGDWRLEMTRRARSTRLALGRHPWVLALIDAWESPGPRTLQHHEAVLACLRASGFTIRDASHAFSLLDSYIHGFALQEQNLPFGPGDDLVALTEAMLGGLPEDRFPTLRELTEEVVLRPDYSYESEFDIGLGLVLDALERLRPP